MTEQSNETGGVKGLIARVPQVLFRVLVVVTVVYFIGFLWTFTGGNVERLFIPFQWEMFFTQRAVAESLEGRWLLYGSSFVGLFVHWLVLMGLISGAYYAYAYITQKKK